MYTKISLLTVVSSLLLLAFAGVESSTAQTTTPQTTIAQTSAKPASPAIERYITDDALAMIRIDIRNFDIDPWIDLVINTTSDELDEMAKSDLETFRVAAGGVQLIVQGAGLSELYLVLDTNETYQKNLVYAVGFVEKDGRPELLVQLMQQLGKLSGTKLEIATFEIATIDGAFVVGSPATLERIRRGPSIARPELAGALAAGEGAPLQAFYLPNRLHRRVLAELAPALPAKFGDLSSREMSGSVQWISLAAYLSPSPSLRLITQSNSEAAAQQIHAFAERGAQLGIDYINQSQEVSPEGEKVTTQLKEFIPTLIPQQQGNQLVTTVTLEEHGDLLTTLLAPALYAQRARAFRVQSSNNLKQLSLSMHVYHNARKHFPAVANFDNQGRPLLSWRVHLLPYLGQQALYEEFHLDEPWDSEHNKALIKRMPDVFRAPSSRSEKAKGLTSYVVPVGEGTIFTGNAQGIRIKEVIDGTSNTILILQVADSEAVIWTKPEDWRFDPEHPLHGLRSPGSDIFQAAFGDGSVHAIKLDVDPEIMRRLLLRGDKQPIPFGSY